MKALYRLFTTYPLLVGWKRRGGASFVGPLDDYSGAQGAYSVARRLLSSYSGNLIRVRRSGDNTESDFGPNLNGDLDSAAVVSFVTAGGGTQHGYVSVVYDQSSFGYNLIQSTAASQLSIVTGGSLNTLNSVPCAESTVDGQFMFTNTFSAYTGSTLSAFLAGKFGGTAGFERFFAATFDAEADNDSALRPGMLIRTGSVNQVCISRNALLATLSRAYSTGFKLSSILNGTNAVLTDGAGSASSASSGSLEINRYLLMGYTVSNGYSTAGAKFTEAFCYQSNQTSNETAIRAILT